MLLRFFVISLTEVHFYDIMSNRSTQPTLNTSPGRSSRETNESNNENPNTISSQNQILLSHWLQRQISSQRIDLSEQFSRLPSDIAVDIDEVADTEETHNESIRYEATQPPVNNQTNPFATVNGILEQNPEVYSVLQSFLRYLPFAILILIKEIYEHTTDIFVISGLFATFIHANNTVKHQVSRQGKRELGPLAVIALNIITCMLFVYFLRGNNELKHSLFLFPPSMSIPISLTSLMWTIVVMDYILKLGIVLIKAIITAGSPRLFQLSSRGKYFVFIEISSQIYRAIATVPLWIQYLLNNHSIHSDESSTMVVFRTLVGVFLCALYLFCKIYSGVAILQKWGTAFTKLFQSCNYGIKPTDEQLKICGPICPICHEEYRKPSFLQCKHIFCEECLAMWLDRERTCPMCRSTVAEDPEWKDGSTAYFVQLF